MLRRRTVPRAFHSLQFRLTAGFAIVLALAIAGVSLYSAAATRAETERFAREVEESRAERVEQLVQDAYEANHDWDQVRYTMGQAAALLGWRVVLVGEDGGVIADSHGMEDGQEFEAGVFTLLPVTPAQFSFEPRVYRRQIFMGGEEFGVVLVVDQEFERPPRPRWFEPRRFAPGPGVEGVLAPTPDLAPVTQPAVSIAVPGSSIEETLAPEPRISQLESSFRRSLILAGGAAGIAGIIFVSMFTRRALSPVRGLTSAARSLGKGDLAYRVEADRDDEVGELARTFNEMAAGLEEAARQRRALTADIAHELRTPLTNIKGYLEAIKDGVVKPDVETVNIIYEQTLHLSRLVEDLRVLAIADAGRLRLDLRPERLDLLAEDAVAAFRPRADDLKIALTVVAPPPVPLADLDRTRMMQVVANLVENALTHTPEGGRVTVGVESPVAGRVRLMVSDTGRGIPEDQLSRIFDQFYRVDPSRSRSTGGAGLGLTIVKRIVEAHGGSVTAESRPGEGAKFVVELPLPRNATGSSP
jgi:two-component system sensor histidine kinase BaeS